MSELVKSRQVISSEMFGDLTVINGEQGVFFIGKEVAEMLGYNVKQGSGNKWLTHCKKVILDANSCLSSNLYYGQRGIHLVPESDIYRLIIKSKLPAAERFEDWVMEEVLPEIRKNGSYLSQPQSLEQRSLALIGELGIVVEDQRLQLKLQSNKN